MRSKQFTSGQILEMGPAIGNLASCDPPTVVLAYKLSKILKLLRREWEEINRYHNEAIIKYGQKREDGRWHIEEDMPSWETYKKENDALMAAIVNLEWEPVVLPETIKGIKPIVFMLLDDFVSLEGQGETKPESKDAPKAG